MNVALFKVKSLISGALVLATLGVAQQSLACGGFFCDSVPINQAAEQIIFKQQGTETTAMIKIDYVGAAEDFGWVLPVPNTPELSLGSDITFTELEVSTRPQFILTREGEGCEVPRSIASAGLEGANFDTASDEEASSGVVIEQSLSVGAFDAQIVSSDDASALATWLTENNLDLSTRGGELLAPYITQKSKFVVLKLKSNANTGSIQPIILKYQSDTPVIPMTLTAVAAEDDMGVLVWLLGDSRAVPENFKHVTPNYTRLNWFGGTRSAYVSYQNLITEAMDEAGGQGFATDFAGYQPNLLEELSSSTDWKTRVTELEAVSDAKYISTMWDTLDSVVQGVIQSELPTSNAFIYSQALVLSEQFSGESLLAARSAVAKAVQEQIIAPLDNSIDILDDNLYLTRLYTTLSAEDMDKNPVFVFNSAMGDQQLTRNATLTASCASDKTHWLLKLGKGTNRDDEVVVDAWEELPFTAVASDQQASYRVEITSASRDPIGVTGEDLSTLTIGEAPNVKDSRSSGFTDVGLLWMLSLLLAFKLSLRIRKS